VKNSLITLLALAFTLAAMSAADAEIIKELDFYENMDVVESPDESIIEDLSSEDSDLLENSDEE
jgi:hypothetical protein